MTEKTFPELSIRTRLERGVLVAKLAGRLSAGPGVTTLRDVLDPRIDSGTALVVLDMADVPYADSMGIEALISLYQKAVGAGGGIRVLHPSTKVRHLLELTRLTAVLGVSDDETTAIDQLLEAR